MQRSEGQGVALPPGLDLRSPAHPFRQLLAPSQSPFVLKLATVPFPQRASCWSRVESTGALARPLGCRLHLGRLHGPDIAGPQPCRLRLRVFFLHIAHVHDKAFSCYSCSAHTLRTGMSALDQLAKTGQSTFVPSTGRIFSVRTFCGHDTTNRILRLLALRWGIEPEGKRVGSEGHSPRALVPASRRIVWPVGPRSSVSAQLGPIPGGGI